ncbi:FAD-dependent monooxygenase [Acidipila sp. EB88]|uniref:FAD-dependent monooxygenase n=1 Tax=Acidipila sp. EB88 TaxID=2305226 RepID=UPI000F5DF4E1|nr:FAD-dependent monooxygenase [Acidipila sp. EB88]RRA49549.1 FAD-binding monooxygenase [Acidipila sp. EB88]
MNNASALYVLNRPTVLIAGASFAGLVSAWWMRRLGYAVTVVEVAPGVRKGGTPVDIREDVVEVMRRMGLLDHIVASSLPPRATEFLDASGEPVVRRPARAVGEDQGEAGWEIERDTLLDLLFDRVRDDVEFVFGDSVAGVEECADEVGVVFASGTRRGFSLLLGCDGTHSAVRRLCFGEEHLFSLFLQNYFSLTIVHKLLIPENTSEMFNVAGRTVMLNAYNGKTDIAFCFFSAEEIGYDRRDRAQQKQMILERFRGQGWRVPELLDEMGRGDDFYFDKLCQIRMPQWSRGRVALVGDAGYCPSPAAGMGGSMAILGAAAFADALARYRGDLDGAFAEYDRSLRPVVNEIQSAAIEFGLKIFAPVSEEAIRQRNALLRAG